MGSFSISCSISNTPIEYDDDVKVGFLVKNHTYNMIGACTQYSLLFPFLMDGVYDDYGQCVFNIPEKTREYVNEFLDDYAMVVKNQKHIVNTDTPMTKANLNIDTIFHYMHEQYLYVRNVYNNYLEDIEFENDETVITPQNTPMMVHPFVIKKSIYDRILSGTFEYQHPFFEDDELVYQDVSFHEKKSDMFKSSASNMFIKYIFEAKNRFTDNDVDIDHAIGKILPNDDKRKAELINIMNNFEYFVCIIIDQLQMNNNDLSRDRIISYMENILEGEDNFKSTIDNFISLYDFYEKNHEDIDLSVYETQMVYDIIRQKSNSSDNKRHYAPLGIYRKMIVSGDLDIEGVKDFHLFTQWYDHCINGTFVPSHYAGQDYCTDSYKEFYNHMLQEIHDYEKRIDEM